MLWQHFGSQSPVLSHEPQSEQIKLNGMCFLVYLINYIVFSLYFLLFPCMSFVSFCFFYFFQCKKVLLYMIFASTKPEANLLQPAPPLEPSAAPVVVHASSGSKCPWLLRVWSQPARRGSQLQDPHGHLGTVPMHPAMILLWYLSIDRSIHPYIHLSIYLSI